MGGGTADANHAIVHELVPLAREFDIVIVAGTMVETADDWSGNTCLVLDGTGFLGKYRKRTSTALSAISHRSSDELGIFETRYGKIGVLICLDIEDDGLLQNVASQCAIIANPAHIPYVPSGSWGIALESVQRRLEWWSCTCGISIVRCDLPPP